MSIPRLLLLLMLIAISVAPIAAQSSPDESPSTFQPLVRLPDNSSRDIRVDQFRLRRFRTQDSPDLQNGVTCYSMRSYRVVRDDPHSDSTSPADYSTCQPVARFGVKNAVGWPETVLP